MKKFCKYGIGIATAIVLYVWFSWNIFPTGMTPFGQMDPADPESGVVKFMMTIMPFIIVAGAALVGQAVGWIVYGIYSFLYFLSHSWVRKVEGGKVAKAR